MINRKKSFVYYERYRVLDYSLLKTIKSDFGDLNLSEVVEIIIELYHEYKKARYIIKYKTYSRNGPAKYDQIKSLLRN